MLRAGWIRQVRRALRSVTPDTEWSARIKAARPSHAKPMKMSGDWLHDFPVLLPFSRAYNFWAFLMLGPSADSDTLKGIRSR